MDGLLLICVVLGVLFVYIVLLGNRSKIPHPKKEAENTGFSFDAIPGASSGPQGNIPEISKMGGLLPFVKQLHHESKFINVR